ncbi:hypothetical protein C0J52_24345 [Blattella germanica]|nr:hypothetical protein C0J52_24345 [Blattella germanica]
MDSRNVSGLMCGQINNYLQELATNYPNLVTLQTIGQSYEGRDLVIIKISSGGSGNPAVLVDAGIHAREWIAPAMALYIIQQLVENNAANSALTNGLDWYILPVLNPDGYEYSHTSVNAAAGGSDDYMKGVGGIALSYTVELTNTIYGFQLPASQIQSTVSRFFAAVKVYGNYVKNNF